MRRDGYPGGDPPDTQLTDREMELILAGSRTGSDDLAQLETFIAGMSRTTPPHDTEQMAAALAARARSTRRTRGLRRTTTIAASAALLVAISGVAMAADRAAPGDAFYAVDRALETIGIGDGGVEERLEEFEVLLEKGNEEEAFEFLTGVIHNTPEAEALEAEQHLEAAVDRKPTAKENNGRNEQALESSPGRSTATENRPNDQGRSNPDESMAEQNGRAIGQDDDAQPPGQEKSDEARTEPGTSGPKGDNASGQAGNNSGKNKEDSGSPDSGPPDKGNPQNNNDPPGQNKND